LLRWSTGLRWRGTGAGAGLRHGHSCRRRPAG
jgi:hypothetical protein